MITKNSTKRIEWIDYAKCLGILLVIFGHSYSSPLTSWLYTFHMPLFFFLSGLTFKVSGSFKDFTKRKAKGLLVPYLGYSVIRLAWLSLLAIAQHNIAVIPKYLLGIFICTRETDYSIGLWFLPLLFAAEMLLYPVFRYAKKSSAQIIILILCGMISFAYTSFVAIPLPHGIDVAPLASLFIFSGVFLKTRIKNPRTSKILIALLINIAAGYLNHRIIQNRVDLYYSRLGNPVLYFISAYGGIFAACWLCQILKSKTNILSSIGKVTLHLYCTHQMIIDAIRILISKKWTVNAGTNIFIVLLINMLLLTICVFCGMVWVKILHTVKSNPLLKKPARQ